ncbi:hypothetical protein DYB28_004903 [Aphanomyces astaci]|uniref:Uncharacterized protein n=1 Tax=Aphanomyces astaci TaxID=112090 RepID=A0A397EFQ9_APHAT|nr:hypothetical protein DYB36_012730 [Aphanomyces astaci]RHY22772.1 hypothetical protein DYB25_013368 [Aphanomyces astaci]RHY42029.1 hypothetical protein DYB38_012586 [Aphanomyces astaci]RHY79260.1 hypothetical protein DYB30_004040 [Aphanomyces astaci]RHZ09138.1 hypothetical protein DYB26_011999 [Aphanomyces astaci]
MRVGFDRTVFDKHGSASAKKRKRDIHYRSALPIAVATTAMMVEGLVAVAVVAQVVITTAVVIMLVVMTVALVVKTVTTAALLMMQSTVTLDAVVLSLLPNYTIIPSSHNRVLKKP